MELFFKVPTVESFGNKETASIYDELGLSHYAAMEAFVRWHF